MSVTSAVSFLLFLCVFFSAIHAHFVPSFDDQNIIGDQHRFSNQEAIRSFSNDNQQISAMTEKEQQKLLDKQAAMDLALLALETKKMEDQKSRSRQYFHRQVKTQSNQQSQQSQKNQSPALDTQHRYENYQNNAEPNDYQDARLDDKTKIGLNDPIRPGLKQKQSSFSSSEGDNYGRSELESDFVNYQEKTLYFRFVEMLGNLVSNIYRRSNASGNSSLGLEDDKIQKQPLTAPSGNSTELIADEGEENEQSTPRTLKSYTLESGSLAEDAQGLAKKRKKLSFIICIMSFGIASITLIKILEATEKRKRSQRGGIIKVPSEEYEIYQI